MGGGGGKKRGVSSIEAEKKEGLSPTRKKKEKVKRPWKKQKGRRSMVKTIGGGKGESLFSLSRGRAGTSSRGEDREKKEVPIRIAQDQIRL